VRFRVRVVKPPPQGSVHGSHSVHSPTSQSTGAYVGSGVGAAVVVVAGSGVGIGVGLRVSPGGAVGGTVVVVVVVVVVVMGSHDAVS
jgi:hypothetical protein